jgi:hypothetical protein
MKAESDTRPAGIYTVEKSGNMADIRFYENVTEKETSDGLRFEYDVYSLAAEYTEDIGAGLDQNTAVWLQKAKDGETPAPVPKTLEERVEETENKVVTLAETIDVLFGGVV